MDYSDLKERVESRVENAFTADDFAMFTRFAEKKIYNSVESLQQKSNKLSSIAQDNPYLTLPSDWLYSHSLAVVDGTGTYHYLLRKDVNFIREAYPNPTTASRPRYFGDFDEDTIILAPTPDVEYGVQLHYASYPISVVDDDEGTSWLIENVPNALIAGVAVQAGVNLKLEQDIMAELREEYKQALSELKLLVDGKQETLSYRDGFSRTQTI